METEIENKYKECNCISGCCKILTTEYKDIIYSLDDDWKESSGRIKKAGCFIYDPSSQKILLVQSRGYMWGSPKGSVQDGEDPIKCAIREVKEETGLIITEGMFIESVIILSKNLYFLVHLKEIDTEKQRTHIESIYIDSKNEEIERNDVNGMMWIKLNCLNNMLNNNKLLINQNTRLLIKRFIK